MADGKEEEVNHAGREQDEDPGVDNGVDGDETERRQIQNVRFLFPEYGVHVDPDLQQRKVKTALTNPNY